MAYGLFAGGAGTPEINQAVLDRLSERFKKKKEMDVAAARRSALERGRAGEIGEYSGVNAATQAESLSGAQAETDLALQAATQGREERLLGEKRAYDTSERVAGQAYGTSERLGSQAYGSGEAEKGRLFSAGESALDRQSALERQRIAGQQQIDLANEEGRGAEREQLLGAGLKLGGTWLANKFGFGGGGGGTGGPGGTAGTPGAKSVFGMGKSPALNRMKVNPSGGFLTNPSYSAGSLAAGAGAGYLGSRLAKRTGLIGKEKSRATSRAAKAGTAGGTALGYMVGGPLGGAVGGALGGKAAVEYTRATKSVGKALKKLCFDGDTFVDMPDGSVCRIKDLLLGMEVKGGRVFSHRQSVAEAGELFEYKNVLVTGYHAVKEAGGWIRVKDSRESRPIPGGSIVWSIGTESHRMFVHGIEFADEFECEGGETMTMDECLKQLQNEKQGVTVNA